MAYVISRCIFFWLAVHLGGQIVRKATQFRLQVSNKVRLGFRHQISNENLFNHLERLFFHFSPYYSSPKYSTPPLPQSSESMLGSPIPDFSQKFYHQYDPHHQSSGPPPGPQAPSSQPHSLTSVSPTSGVSF